MISSEIRTIDHIGYTPREEEIKLMLDKIGVDSLEKLIEETIPKDIRLSKNIELEKEMSES